MSKRDRKFIKEFGQLPEMGDIADLDVSTVIKEEDLDKRRGKEAYLRYNNTYKAQSYDNNLGGEEVVTTTHVVADQRKKVRLADFLAVISPPKSVSSVADVAQQSSQDDGSSDTESSDDIDQDSGEDEDVQLDSDYSDESENVSDNKSAVSAYDGQFSDYGLDSELKKIFDNKMASRMDRRFIKEVQHIDKQIVRVSKLEADDRHGKSSTSVKPRLQDAYQKMASSPLMRNMLEYRDIHIFYKTYQQRQSLIEQYCLHALNHVHHTRDLVIENNEKLRADDSNLEIKDQGYSRPKVLILLPFKNDALQVINSLMLLSGAEQVMNKKRFQTEFSLPADEDNVDSAKPVDYLQTFEGNIDDCFRIGIKVQRKAMKLYSDFYGSDILVCSPLGLRMIIKEEGDKDRDFDFLSSIEVLVVDGADVVSMQNWDHLLHVFKHLNLKPSNFNQDIDFARVKHLYLDGNAKYVRQNIIISRYQFPELNALCNRFCLNIAGSVQYKREVYDGCLANVEVPGLKQIFIKVGNVSSHLDAEDARFQYLIDTIIPSVADQRKQSLNLAGGGKGLGCCIVVPTYLEFLKLRNWFEKLESDAEQYVDAPKPLSYVAISEYSSAGDISRSRSHFYHGKRDFMVVTERFHYFRRYRLRGIKQLVFSGPVANAHFYTEFASMLVDLKNTDADVDELLDRNSKVVVLYSKYDALALERIVGTSKLPKMIHGSKELFMFSTQ
ncbi:hypothetical protein MP228_005918 [Amoeboaphelidium protococcarum]|nr:hypothetical protein MP228_005918 [Amoeboaphelidium protococcarum]